MEDKHWILYTITAIMIIFVASILTTVRDNTALISQVKDMIDQHSVHPIYGNYKKKDSHGNKCSPWDSCK